MQIKVDVNVRGNGHGGNSPSAKLLCAIEKNVQRPNPHSPKHGIGENYISLADAS
jgi:hypothetical protein